MVITFQSIDEGRVTLTPKASGEEDRFVEVEGAADLIVEIVNDRSVKKDTDRLPGAYFRAGVREFWLIDARAEHLLFLIHRRGNDRFAATPSDAEGFQRSDVLHGFYRLDRNRHQRGHWVYRLNRK